MKRRNNIFIVFLLSAFIGFAGLVVWEFNYDIDPKEAVAFFSQIDTIPDEENAAYTIAGIAAPLGTEDIHAWGYSEVLKNRERSQRDEEPIFILDDQPGADKRLYIDL
jgi:hypothetical protein